MKALSEVSPADLESRIAYADTRHRARVHRAARSVLRELQRRQNVLTAPFLTAMLRPEQEPDEQPIVDHYCNLGSLIERIEKELAVRAD